MFICVDLIHGLRVEFAEKTWHVNNLIYVKNKSKVVINIHKNLVISQVILRPVWDLIYSTLCMLFYQKLCFVFLAGFCLAWWRVEVLIKRGYVKRRFHRKLPVYQLLSRGQDTAARLLGDYLSLSNSIH